MPFVRPDKSIPVKALLQRFALILLPVIAILSAVLWWSTRLNDQRQLEKIKGREESRIELARRMIVHDYSDSEADLRMIASLPLLRGYFDSANPAQSDEVARIFLVLARELRRYDQVRYLDASGQEIIRINYNDGKPAIVPREQLQNKSERYFFRDTLKLDKDEIYVSPLDLNIEHGQLEIPYKPVVRFGTPVFDSAGRKKGVIILNYLGRDLIERFRENMQGGDSHTVMLLNRDGYWLSSPKPGDEWGFMLGKSERTFGRDFAEEWRVISANVHGALTTTNGLFVYTTVHPLLSEQHSSTGSALAGASSGAELAAHEYYWKIVSFIPQETLSRTAFYNQANIRIWLAVTGFSIALAAWIITILTLSRKHARAALMDALEKAKRFADAIDSVPAYVYIKNRQHQYVYGNQLVLELFKCSADELPGSGDSQFFPPATVARLREVDDRVLEQGETTHEEIDVAPDTPEHRVYWEVKHPIYDDQGGIWGICGVSTDITVRKEMEQTLALHSELVQRMAEGMILIRTRDGIIQFTNPAFEQMFGYEPGELIGKPVAILNAPTEKTPEEVAEAINATLRQHGVWQGEIENIKKDGTHFWCLSNVSTFVHPQYGEVWLAIHQDITARKAAEEQLRKSAEEIEDLYNHAPCGYHSLDEHGLIVRINDTELKWLGYSREEVVGKMNYTDLLTPAGLEMFHKYFPRLKERGYVHDLEFELKRKDGNLLPVFLNATAIHDAAGQFVMSRSTLFDLAERKKLERKLEQQARSDMLTNLNNRRYFFELAELELERSRRYGGQIAMLMIDVDHFKGVNDTYGHSAGDTVLEKLSAVMIHTLREIDIIGRIGGEEFAALLPGTENRRALEAAERLRAAVAKTAVLLEQGITLNVTVSIGVSSLTETDVTVDTLIRRADDALYQAKKTGRNRVCSAGMAS